MDSTARNIEDNLYSFYTEMGKCFPFGKALSGDYVYIQNMNNEWPNQIFIIRDQSIDLFKEIIEGINRKKLPPLIIVNNDYINEKVQNLMQQNNIREIYRWTGMYLDKSQKITNVSGPLEIKKVKTITDFSAWVHIINTEVLVSRKMNPDRLKDIIDNDKFELFLGFYQGNPVSTSMTYFDENSAGLYFIATRKAYRSQGFGTQITSHSINNAQKKNKRVVLQATPAGEKLYAKQGFKAHGGFGIYWKVGME